MEVRDAVEADATAMAAIADAPVDVMRNLVHDRTVRVAEVEQGDEDPNLDIDVETTTVDRDDDDRDDDRQMVGFVSFDARQSTVHVTQIEGSSGAVERLLEEPIRFATEEGMSVELLLTETDDGRRDTVERVGFQAVGSGPRFEGVPTTRFRMD